MLLTACALMLVGLCLTLILDGQEFTNGLLAISCFYLAAGVALWGRREKRSGGFAVALLAILMSGILMVGLPEAYRAQRSFNHRIEQARRAAREPKAGSGVAPESGAGASARIEGEGGGPPGGREDR